MKKVELRESQAPYTLDVDEDTLADEPVILERNGEPVAALVPFAEYQNFRAWQQAKEHRRRADLEAFEREREAYERLEPDLIEEYEGLYVAIRDGKVIDSDQDETTLVMRVYEEHGYGPMYVGKVGAPLPVRRIPSPRVIRE